jgi:hypothetical protein
MRSIFSRRSVGTARRSPRPALIRQKELRQPEFIDLAGGVGFVVQAIWHGSRVLIGSGFSLGEMP